MHHYSIIFLHKDHACSYTHMPREFDNLQGKEQHTTNPMQWNSIREIEIMSHGKPSTTTQHRTTCFHFTPKPRSLFIDQLPHVDLLYRYLIPFFIIWFPLVSLCFYGSFYPFSYAFPRKARLFLPQGFCS